MEGKKERAHPYQLLTQGNRKRIPRPDAAHFANAREKRQRRNRESVVRRKSEKSAFLLSLSLREGKEENH